VYGFIVIGCMDLKLWGVWIYIDGVDGIIVVGVWVYSNVVYD
jgi:hypothetical protein